MTVHLVMLVFGVGSMIKILLVAFILATSLSSFANQACMGLFSTKTSLSESDIDNVILGLYDLRSRMLNSSGTESKMAKIEFEKMRKELSKYIPESEILIRLKEVKRPRELKQNKEAKVQAPDILDQLLHIHDFIEVPAGAYSRMVAGPNGIETINVSITKNFEIMSTLVSQKTWTLVMETNPSEFRDGIGSTSLKFGTNKVLLRPDYPVERVDRRNAEKFIEKLNELSEKDSPILYEAIPSHTKGVTYRLPTEAEWYLVATRLKTEEGQSLKSLIKNGNWEALEKYVSSEESLMQLKPGTRPVKFKWPLLLDGKTNREIYDFIGNLAVHVEDSASSKPASGIDPVFKKYGFTYMILGMSWDHRIKSYNIGDRASEMDSKNDDRTGVRLVRIPAP